MSNLLVLVEHTAGRVRAASLEALGAAHATGGQVTAVLAGAGAAEVAATLGSAGASKAVVLEGEGYSPDGLAQDIAGLCRDHSINAFLVAGTARGKDVAPRVAALLDSTLFSDCTGFSAAGDTFQVTRPWLAGKLIATLESASPVLCATLRRNVFSAAAGDGTAEVSTQAATTTGKSTLQDVQPKPGDKLDVAEAPVVVSGGRGLKEPEHFAIIEGLADAFGNAAVGASRAVVDAGWRPHGEQVGQTGKTVSPQLYIAVGISGAIQHLAGMKTAKVIVAINKDADAPIFKIADYGIVGDAFEIVPALTEAVKAERAKG